ncbi:hypothetical protein RSAG8_05286, partial [Rhizoctonia solani AG-8 WAC10335]
MALVRGYSCFYILSVFSLWTHFALPPDFTRVEPGFVPFCCVLCAYL